MLFRRCPHCGGGNVHRSRRRGLHERIVLRLRGQRPYRCYNCGQRFYAEANAVRETDPPAFRRNE